MTIAAPLVRVLTGKLSGPTAVRMATAPISLLANMLVVSMVIDSRGVDVYATLAILLSVQTLFVLMDLGTGGAVLNAAASWQATRDDERLVAPLRAALVTSASVALLAFLLGAIMSVSGLWSRALGAGTGRGDADLAVGCMLLLNVFTRPLIHFQNALVGLGGARTVVLTQLAVPVVNVVLVATGLRVGAPLAFLAIGVMSGQLVGQICCAAAVRNRVPGIARSLAGGRPARAHFRDASVIAGPMLVIATVAPLYTALDRILLSHLSSLRQVAEYSLAMQFVVPLSALFVTLQQTLWADFAQRREAGEPELGTLVRKAQRVVVAVGLTAATALALVVPYAASFVSKGEVSVAWILAIVLAVNFAVQLMQLPASALLTTPAGLRFQARAVVLSVAVNLALTASLASSLGAVAAGLGTALGSVVLLAALLVRGRTELSQLASQRMEQQ